MTGDTLAGSREFLQTSGVMTVAKPLDLQSVANTIHRLFVRPHP